jgi:DNA-binding response OmpR family regulator
MQKKQVDVLLIDDDPDICQMLTAILEFEGFNTYSCTVPAEIPKLLSGMIPCLILMDMLLSGADGRDLCMELKSDPAFSQVRIVMMSAHPDAEQTCLKAGADDFIAKPFDFDYFMEKIRLNLNGQGVNGH